MSENKEQSQFALQRIYTKDISFEAPNSPAAFTKQWKPEVKLDLNTSGRKVDEQHYEVSVKITITAKNDDETAFLVELVQCGLFAVVNIPEQQLGAMLGAICPNIRFTREPDLSTIAINTISSKGQVRCCSRKLPVPHATRYRNRFGFITRPAASGPTGVRPLLTGKFLPCNRLFASTCCPPWSIPQN